MSRVCQEAREAAEEILDEMRDGRAMAAYLAAKDLPENPPCDRAWIELVDEIRF